MPLSRLRLITRCVQHHKFCVIDSKLLINGSYNWTRQAAVSNQENIVVTNQPDLVRDFEAHFAAMWADKQTFSAELKVTHGAGRR